MFTTNKPKITFDTLEAALILLSERNAKSKSRLTIEDHQGREWLLQAVRDVAALERIERQLRRSAEYRCNYPMTEAEEAARDKREARLEAKAAEIVKPYKVGLKLGGDVRGSQVRLLTPNTDRHNTWGGASDGWAL